MTPRRRSRTARLAGLALGVGLLVVSSALASQKATRTAVEASRGSQEHKALLELYALDSRLAASHARVADLTAAAAKLKRERAALRSELSAARITLASAQGRLALQLRTLYEQGHVDPLAVMFGATSLSQGMRKLDDLRHVADTSSRVVGATRAAEHRLLHARRTLAAHAKRLAGLLVAARAADQSLSSAAASKAAYVASLRAPDKAELLSTAQAATDKSQTIGHSKPPPPPPTGGRKMVADATCYILKGITASGLPVGPGIVAVDPTVIPLGTRLYIPGYGKGIAADIGGGIKGNIIDLWYPTYAACAKWGRRTVTITVY